MVTYDQNLYIYENGKFETNLEMIARHLNQVCLKIYLLTKSNSTGLIPIYRKLKTNQHKPNMGNMRKV